MAKRTGMKHPDLVHYGDWLTALSPMLLMMVVYHRWAAVWAVVCATAGYAAAMVLWCWLLAQPVHIAPALLCGVVVAACLPATTAVWVAALAGLVAGVAAVLPLLAARLCKDDSIICPLYFPALTGYVVVRYACAAQFAHYTLPVMWAASEGAVSAAPLTALSRGVETAESVHRLFWGFTAGSMGGTCTVALLLGFIYLLLCRRVRLWAPMAMVAVVSALSWCFWSAPAYGLLIGGTLLAALLMGEGSFVFVGWKGQLCAGVLAGGVTVACRLWWGMDGSAVGVLAAGLLIPVLHIAYHAVWPWVVVLAHKFAKTEK